MFFNRYDELFSTKSKELLKIFRSSLSGRQDSNLRPPHPKCGAMTGLRYAPKFFLLINKKKYLQRGRSPTQGVGRIYQLLLTFCGEGGIRTLGTGLSPYNGLANRPFRPLRHLSSFINRGLQK